MLFPGKHFGKGEGVPRKDLALEALGVDVEGSKGLKGDRGSKGPEDEIRLSAQERESATKAERGDKVWTMDTLRVWGKEFGMNAETIEVSFYIQGDQVFVTGDMFSADDLKGVTYLPAGLTLQYLQVSPTVEELPPRLTVHSVLDLRNAEQIHHIPEDLTAKEVRLRDGQDQLLEQVQKLGLKWRTYMI